MYPEPPDDNGWNDAESDGLLQSLRDRMAKPLHQSQPLV